MKIIFSRKGFDSAAGGVPSPILPDGSLISLPIPEIAPPGMGLTYKDVQIHGESLGKLVEDLAKGQITQNQIVHLDPDLRAECVQRGRGWRPLFGQAYASQSHLKNHGIGPRDLFLFYGWFRQVHSQQGQYQYAKGSPHLHVMFGWLQVGKVIQVGTEDRVPSWATYHPHFQQGCPYPNNTVYISSKRLELPGRNLDLPGGGLFTKLGPELQLTAPGERRRSIWQLPPWFYPSQGRTALSYHDAQDRWQREADHVQLRTTGRGQEFVFNSDEYPESLDWLESLFRGTIC